MNQLLAQGIILSRTDFGEADRIITLLTPNYGKLRLMARGVRRAKSKLAGGIELFSVSDITFIRGKGEIGTLVSARLHHHYGNIVKDVQRTMLGYELIKQLNRATEDEPEDDYFGLLQATFAALDDHAIHTELVRFWFMAVLIRLSGHMPNLQTDISGQPLQAEAHYNFSFDDVMFQEQPVSGVFVADHIKFLRLAFSVSSPKLLNQVQGIADLLPATIPIVQTLYASYVQR